MKIEQYACDLCGTVLPDLSCMEQIDMECTAENYNKKFTYYVCPFCASVFKGLSDDKMEKLLLNQLQFVIEKDNV